MDTITFRHQDGDMTFRVSEATFAITPDNHLTLSVKCEQNPEHTWMASPRFCLVDIPLDSALASGTVVRFAGPQDEDEADDWPSDGPRAHVYVGTHEMPRDVEVRFTRVSGDACEAELSWAQADVNYYNEQAKPNRVVGKCRMQRGPVEKMWIPK